MDPVLIAFIVIAVIVTGIISAAVTVIAGVLAPLWFNSRLWEAAMFISVFCAIGGGLSLFGGIAVWKFVMLGTGILGAAGSFLFLIFLNAIQELESQFSGY